MREGAAPRDWSCRRDAVCAGHRRGAAYTTGSAAHPAATGVSMASDFPVGSPAGAQPALSVADRGYVMENGEIVRVGTARELEHDPEVQRAYLGEIAVE